MGFNVGLPFKKCAITPAGRTSNKAAPKTGFLAAIAAEFFDERQGRDNDINHDMTIDNIWLVRERKTNTVVDKKTGEVTEKIQMNSYIDYMKDTNKIIEEDNIRRKQHGFQKGRKDQVSAVAGIIKPPIQISSAKDFDYKGFFQDAIECMNILANDKYRCGEIDAAVIHLDEPIGKDDNDDPLMSPHCHYLMRPFVYEIDKETGEKFKTLNAKKFYNSVFLNNVNKLWPSMMRERGWDVDDCKLTEEIENELEKKQHKEKAKGLDGVHYKAQMDREKEKLKEQIDLLQEENKTLQEDINKKNVIISKQDKRIEKQEYAIKHNHDVIENIKIKYDDLKQKYDSIEEKYSKLIKKYNQTVNQLKALTESIQPVERLKSLLYIAKSFKNDFRAFLEMIREYYHLNDQQIKQLKNCEDLIENNTAAQLDQLIDDVMDLQKKTDLTDPLKKKMLDQEVEK